MIISIESITQLEQLEREAESANKKKDVFVIPKVGYFHLVNRNGSLATDYAQNMSDRESEFWVELARKEYLYKTDRKKTYEE